MKELLKKDNVTKLENPFVNARRNWNEHTKGLLDDVRLWQSVCLISMMIALAAVGGVIYIGSKSKFVPYIIEVDKLGQPLAVSPAQVASPANQRVINYSLAAFISNARMVTPDTYLQRKAIFSIYSMLNRDDPATAKMTEWLNGNPDSTPFKRAEKETVEIEIVSVIPQSPETWQIEWSEKVYDRQGNLAQPPYRMKALVTINITPATSSTSEDKLRQNPLGIYVRDFSWSKQT